MKKMIMVLMMVFTMMAGLFAYQPHHEFFEVIDNTAFYKEEVKVEDDVLFNEYMLDDNRCFTRRLCLNLKKLEYEAEKNYFELLYIRNYVEHLTKENKLYEFYGETYLLELNKKNIERKINEAVYRIPFVTRENFYKVSKRKYIKTYIKYMQTLKK